MSYESQIHNNMQLNFKTQVGLDYMKSTMHYINLEAALYHSGNADDFHFKVVATIEEACKLLETGFEYVTNIDGNKLFRKRK